MSAPKSKYDYPGLPLWDRDGNPVGVGDRVVFPSGAAVTIYHIGNSAVGWREGVRSVATYPTGHRMAVGRLLMPPGFPKDRRVSMFASTFRFTDDWHGYWIGSCEEDSAERVGYPCSNVDWWEFDGEGNPVKAEATCKESLKVEPAPEPTELDRLRERVEALERIVEDLQDARVLANADTFGPDIPASVVHAELGIDPLPTDPADWEPCEWDGKTFPVFMRDRISGKFVEQFLDAENSVLVAENNVNLLGRKYKWIDFKAAHGSWTPVRPKRRQPEPDPLSDEALKAWFWAAGDGMEVWKHPCRAEWKASVVPFDSALTATAPTRIAALRSLRQQDMERENGGAE